ncbi:MAG: ABC transporter permease, partial [Pseudomonadota bacterium]
MGAIIGLLTAQGDKGLMIPYLLAGAVIFAALSYVASHFIPKRILARVFCALVLAVAGGVAFGGGYALLIGVLGWVLGGYAQWLKTGEYRLNLPPYATSGEVLWFYSFRAICAAIFLFLITPIIILIPLSFNQQPYFSFTPEMLSLNPEGYSLRWYWDILRNGM